MAGTGCHSLLSPASSLSPGLFSRHRAAGGGGGACRPSKVRPRIRCCAQDEDFKGCADMSKGKANNKKPLWMHQIETTEDPRYSCAHSFWTDSWLQGSSIQSTSPNLIRLVPRRHIVSRTVSQALADDRWKEDVTGTLDELALAEYLALSASLQGVHLQAEVPDSYTWRWTVDGQYSARSAYKALHRGAIGLHGAELIWKSWMPMKVKFFLWLGFHQRLWTADRRIRHGLQTDGRCRLCDQEDETCFHMFCQCSYSTQVWWPLLSRVGIVDASATSDMKLQCWWIKLRKQLPRLKRRGFDTLFALTCWQIWKERNARIFRNAETTPLMLLQLIKSEGDNWIAAGATKLGCLFSE